MLSLLRVSGDVASAVARDAPIVFAIVACLWAHRRLGDSLRHPRPLVALALVCVASRLVFESVVFPYYLLAASALFFALDLVADRLPHRSMAWCAAAALFVGLHLTNRTIDALGTMILAVLAVAAGLVDLGEARAKAVL